MSKLLLKKQKNYIFYNKISEIVTMSIEAQKSSCNLYTGYFAKLKIYKQANLIPVSIAGVAPSWYTHSNEFEFKKLAPKFWFYKKYKDGMFTKEEYTKHYLNEVLSKWENPNTLKQELIDLFQKENSNGIILLCYESPNNFCHRQIVREFLQINEYLTSKGTYNDK